MLYIAQLNPSHTRYQKMNMRFCPQCDSIMKPIMQPGSDVMFQCRCMITVKGNADDTLVAEGHIGQQSTLSYESFIQQSAFDLAGHKVRQQCPRCPLNFMTLIRIGTAEVVMYTCTCGYSGTREEYLRDTKIATPKSVTKAKK